VAKEAGRKLLTLILSALKVAALSAAALLVLVAANMTVGLLSWIYLILATGN